MLHLARLCGDASLDAYPLHLAVGACTRTVYREALPLCVHDAPLCVHDAPRCPLRAQLVIGGGRVELRFHYYAQLGMLATQSEWDELRDGQVMGRGAIMSHDERRS